MAKTPEGKVKDPVLKWSRLNGVKYIPMYFRLGVTTGWPDTIFLIPGGRPFFLEAKAHGKEPTKKQYLRIQELEALGYDVAWYDDADAAIKTLDKALREAAL